jgi:hypothetical protein
MKTAVLFYGEIRGHPLGWKQLFDNLVSPNNADVFIHGYRYAPDWLTKFSEEDRKNMLDFHRNKGIHTTPPQLLFDIFKPVSTLIEEQISHVDENMENVVSILRRENYMLESANLWGYNIARSQTYTRKRVIELKKKYEEEHGFKYDNVILTRLDFNLMHPVKFTERLTVIKVRLWEYWKICDQIMAGPSYLIDTIVGFYEAAPKLWVQHCKNGIHFQNGEFFLGVYLRINNIPLDYFEWPSDWTSGKNGLYRFSKTLIGENEDCSILIR